MANFKPSARIERGYIRQMRGVMKEIQKIVDKYYDPAKPDDVKALTAALREYAEQLQPWARTVAKTYIKKINTANLLDWLSVSMELSDYFKRQYKAKNPVFEAAWKWQRAQVNLIVTIPRRMATRAQELARKWKTGGLRPETLARSIQQTAKVADFVATRIARTEISKAHSTLTRARATSVGITHYEWITAGDQIVRSAHRRMLGKICEFENPPFVSIQEGRHHPGEFPNCRCFARPIISEAQLKRLLKERGLAR